jgi:enoyl-CoA hydratase/carnithine racemase
MFLTGQTIDAKGMLRLGIFDEVVSAEHIQSQSRGAGSKARFERAVCRAGHEARAK